MKEEQRQFHAAHALWGHHSWEVRRLSDLIYRLYCKLYLVGQSLFCTLLFPKFDLTYVMTSLWQIIQKQPKHNSIFG